MFGQIVPLGFIITQGAAQFYQDLPQEVIDPVASVVPHCDLYGPQLQVRATNARIEEALIPLGVVGVRQGLRATFGLFTEKKRRGWHLLDRNFI